MKPPINHMILHDDALADEFDAILDYRNILDPMIGGSGITYTPVYYYETTSGDIYVAGLHSSAATADGISDGSTQGGGQTFTANGMDPTLTYKAVRRVMTAGEEAALQAGARLTATFPLAAIQSTTTVAAVRYPFGSSAGYMTKGTSGDVKCDFPRAIGTATYLGVTPFGKPAKIKVELMCDRTYAWLIVDGLPQGRMIDPAISYGAVDARPSANTWDAAVFGGLTTVAGYWIEGGYYIENVSVNSTPFTYTAHPDISSVMLFGDSLTCQGSVQATIWSANNAYTPWNPGYGFASDGVTPATTGSFFDDQGYVCELIRQLIKGGFCTVNTPGTSNQAVSGATFAGILTKVNAQSTVPKLCFVGGGTNDIAGSRTGAAVQSDCRAIIDALIAKGATHIVFWVPPSLRAAPAYQTSGFDAVQTEINAVISALPAYSARVTVVDLFTYFGGFSVDTTKFQTTNVHPNAEGSTLIGQLMGQAAVSALTGV